MKKISQKEIILKHLRDTGEWIPAYKLRGVATQWGFIGHQGDRRARELAEDEKIEHKIEKKFAYYKAKAPTKIETYYVPDINKTIQVKLYE